MERPRILVVEDDGDISNMLLDLLEQNDFSGVPAYSGTEALLLLEREEFALVLLDLMLPGKSGTQVLEELRGRLRLRVPVIAVTAMGRTASKVELLGGGADDYLTKPFHNDELIARIQVQLRNFGGGRGTAEGMLRHGDLRLDPGGLTVTLGGKALSLTRRELLILKLLLENPNKVFTKNNIYESVWGEEFFGDENTVNVHISNLRAKLAKVRPGVEYIQTVWGIGFKLADPASGAPNRDKS